MPLFDREWLTRSSAIENSTIIVSFNLTGAANLQSAIPRNATTLDRNSPPPIMSPWLYDNTSRPWAIRPPKSCRTAIGSLTWISAKSPVMLAKIVTSASVIVRLGEVNAIPNCRSFHAKSVVFTFGDPLLIAAPRIPRHAAMTDVSSGYCHVPESFRSYSCAGRRCCSAFRNVEHRMRPETKNQSFTEAALGQDMRVASLRQHMLRSLDQSRPPVPAVTNSTCRAPFADESFTAALLGLHRFHVFRLEPRGLGDPCPRPGSWSDGSVRLDASNPSAWIHRWGLFGE